jgi:translation initiation factor 3 subunit C
MTTTTISLMLEKAGKPHNTHLRVFTSTSRPSTRLAEKRCASNCGLHVTISNFPFLPQNTDRADQIRILERLLEVAVTPYQRIRVLLALVSSRFDYNATVASYMPIEMWLSAQLEIDSLIATLIEYGSYSVQEVTEEYDDLVERTPEGEKDGVVRIRGSIISFVDRLDDEFARSLQNLDPHGTEYVDRLKDEKGLYCTICRAETLYEKKQLPDPLARVIMRRLEHIYSKVHSLAAFTFTPV